jgi:hypothetical protein
MHIERVWRSPDLRVVSVMVAGIAVFGVVDGSRWKVLLTPTLAYRPAVLFGLMLVFGWRGFFGVNSCILYRSWLSLAGEAAFLSRLSF